MKTSFRSLFPSLSATLFLAPLAIIACGSESEKEACQPDFNAIESQRVELCKGRLCGDISFKDEQCGDNYTRSCGSCLSGETCTPQGICAECTADPQCTDAYNGGYFCNSSLRCERHADYCDTLGDCTAKGLGKCENNRCVSTSCGTEGQSCDPSNNEMCIKGKCIPIIPMGNTCSLSGTTTGAPSAIQAFAHLSAPEAVYELPTSAHEALYMLTVTPSGIDFDPAIYLLSSISPITVARGADNLEDVMADADKKGESEMLLFTAEANATYYLVITSDPSKQDGQYKQGRFTLCLENDAQCSASCESEN